MAKPSPSATHGNSYFKFSGLSRDGKVDKLITPRHLQALERLLHSQHVFAHQFTSQGIQHFLWAWQRSLSPSNIFRPCRRAYERCMRRIYGTLKNKNSRSKLSPSNIFRPCRRAYERCMRRIYGTLKNKNSRSKCTCLVKA